MPMHLSSWHTPGFELTSGWVDHTRSYYYNNYPEFPAAYAKLAKDVGTDQIIWCYAHREEYINSADDDRVEWILDVPDGEILRIVDGFIWNRIVGIKTYPKSLHNKWLREAPLQEPARHAFIDQQIEEYYSRQPPSGGWWSQLYITDSTIEGATALLKHPIPESWVTSDGRAASST